VLSPRILATVLIAAALGVQLTDATHRPANSNKGAVSSYIVSARSLSAAREAVRRVDGKLTHELDVIDSVAAQLTAEQRSQLAADPSLSLSLDKVITVSGYQIFDEEGFSKLVRGRNTVVECGFLQQWSGKVIMKIVEWSTNPHFHGTEQVEHCRCKGNRSCHSYFSPLITRAPLAYRRRSE